MRPCVRFPLGPWSLGLVLTAVGCSGGTKPEREADKPSFVEPTPAAKTPADAEPDEPEDGDDEAIVYDDVPTEPEVTLEDPGGGSPVALAPRTAGQDPRRIVVSVRLTEGRKKKLHLPRVELLGDLALTSIDDSGSRYRWTPTETVVHAQGDGVDPEFLAAFEAALAVSEAPGESALAIDRWDAVTEFEWTPTGDNAHAAEIAAAQRLALGHLAVPIPSLSMANDASWKVVRKLDVLGIPTWQVLSCTAKKIEGDQVEINASVLYYSRDGEPATGTPLGLEQVVSMRGSGKLRARYDLRSALPVEMQLRSRLDIVSEPGGRAQRFGFEVRADEDFVANLDSRITLDGQFVQGGLVHGVVPAGTKVWFNNKRTQVSPEGDFLIGFGRDSGPRARLSLAFEGAPAQRHVVRIAGRQFEPETIDGLPPEMVDLDRATRKALSKSKVRIKRLRNKASKTPYFRDGFVWPMKGKLTSTYGRKRILNGQDRGYHWGVDLAAPVGTKVRAPAGGVVVLAEQDVPLSGNLIILDHGQGLTSSFLHLEKLKVAVGDEVKQGQVIATAGNTGRSTGPHLDWRMNLFDTRIDPMTLVPPR